MPRLTICADDFGLNRPVDEAIIDLVREGRLNAVSCMAGGDDFAQSASNLREAAENAPIKVEIGLHLTLTEYVPLGPMPTIAPDGHLPSVGALLLKSHLGGLKSAEIDAEAARQWGRFQDVMGRAPDFIDGHQHAHLMPGIRESVIEHARAKLPAHGWVRSCLADHPELRLTTLSSWRVRIISGLARKMQRLVGNAGLSSNSHFYGINDFNKGEDFAGLMQDWLRLAASRSDWSVIMCHPGLPSTIGRKAADDRVKPVHDPIAARRPDEYAYFAGPEFPADLAKFGLTL